MKTIRHPFWRDKSCGDCIYHIVQEHDDGTTKDKCVRYPPQRTDRGSLYPVVARQNFCGEFDDGKKKEKSTLTELTDAAWGDAHPGVQEGE